MLFAQPLYALFGGWWVRELGIYRSPLCSGKKDDGETRRTIRFTDLIVFLHAPRTNVLIAASAARGAVIVGRWIIRVPLASRAPDSQPYYRIYYIPRINNADSVQRLIKIARGTTKARPEKRTYPKCSRHEHNTTDKWGRVNKQTCIKALGFEKKTQRSTDPCFPLLWKCSKCPHIFAAVYRISK